MIEALNLTKRYGSYTAIDKISFHIKKGELIGFLGPNGAGKTSTMRILTGFIPPTSGSVKVAGYDIVTQSLNARKHVGYLPESVPLYREMKVRSFLEFSGRIKGMDRKKRKARINDVIDLCRLEKYAGTHIGKLSKGYRQLVGISQAILNEPDVLVLDEPTVGIDARQVVEIRKLIKKLGQEHTVILSSHILSEVSMLCEKVIILNQGRIAAQDRTENLSKQLKDRQRFELEVGGKPKKIISVLKSVPGVLSATANRGDKSDFYSVECASDSDLREELTGAIVKNKLSLLGMTSHEMSLEEIFLELTKDKQERKNA